MNWLFEFDETYSLRVVSPLLLSGSSEPFHWPASCLQSFLLLKLDLVVPRSPLADSPHPEPP
jgi:hypothetical protein